jgi:hypothetical protein
MFMLDKNRHIRGQTTTETILLLPVFLMLAFLLLQLGQIGIALSVVSYGASSIAKRAVAGETPNPSMMDKLLAVGMKDPKVVPEIVPDPSNPLTKNITINTCAAIKAFPFVGEFLNNVPALTNNSPGSCGNASKTLSISCSPDCKFLVHGKAIARGNYGR